MVNSFLHMIPASPFEIFETLAMSLYSSFCMPLSMLFMDSP
jgi:hypothetical protein